MLKKLFTIAFIFLLIGALNWGLVGILNLDLVASIFGAKSIVSRIIYSLVGISGIFIIVSELLKKD